MKQRRASLVEQLTEPSLNGIRTHSRQKRESKTDIDDASVPVELCQTIHEEARRQRQDVEVRGGSLPEGAALLANSLRAALAKLESEEEDEDVDIDGVMDWDDHLAEVMDDDLADHFQPSQAIQESSFADIVFDKIQKIKKTQRKAAEKDGIDANIVKLYEGIGDLLSRYTTGKIPRALRFVPNLTNWEEVLYLTRPDNWSPHAYMAVTKLFLNSNPRMAQRYMNRILLPHLRQEIERKQKLHLALYEALKHTCHIPGAFYKGIIIPLCRSGACTVREAVIFSSVIKRTSLPVQHSAAALLCLAEMQYSGPTSFFIQTLLSKNYAMPFKALDGMVEHFMRFEREEATLPAIWHQSLLMFVQSYKQDIKREDLSDLRRLIKKQHHRLISIEIYRGIDAILDTDIGLATDKQNTDYMDIE